MTGSIPTLTPVDPWPTRKLPQDTFDAKVKAAMDQMSTMVGELNDDFIPAANGVIEVINEITPDLPTILDAPNQASAAAGSASAAAGSVTAAASEADRAADEADRAADEADRAEEAADRAVAVADVGPATADKIGLTKPDMETIEVGEDGTLSVPTFAGSSVGLVPASTSADAKKVLLGNGTWGSSEDDAAAMTISQDLILTADSPRTIVLTASASGLSVRLPNHATLPDGTTFHIIVRPLEDIKLCDSSGQPIKAYPVLTVSTAIRVQLVDASTGLWALSEYKSGSTSDAQGKPGLNIGEMTIFNSTGSGNLSVAALSEDKVLVCYREPTSPYNGKVCVLSISGTTVSAGDTVVFDELHNVTSLSVATLSENKAVVFYIFYDLSYYVGYCVLTISGMTVSAGDTDKFTNTTNATGIKSVAVSENNIIVVYKIPTSIKYLYTAIVTVFGTSCTLSNQYEIGHGNSSYSLENLFSLSEDKYFLAYKEDGQEYSTILTVSGTSVTVGDTKNLSSNIGSSSLIKLSPSLCVATYGNARAQVCCLEISGTTITEGSPIPLDELATNSGYLVALSTTKFLLFCNRDDSLGYYVCYLCEVSGSSVVITGTIPSNLATINVNYLTLISPSAPTILMLDSGTAGVLYFA